MCRTHNVGRGLSSFTTNLVVFTVFAADRLSSPQAGGTSANSPAIRPVGEAALRVGLD